MSVEQTVNAIYAYKSKIRVDGDKYQFILKQIIPRLYEKACEDLTNGQKKVKVFFDNNEFEDTCFSSITISEFYSIEEKPPFHCLVMENLDVSRESSGITIAFTVNIEETLNVKAKYYADLHSWR